MRLFLYLVSLSFVASIYADDPTTVYFGTSKNAEGIYTASFDAKKGKLSQPTLAAEIASPGFLAISTDRSKLYAIAKQDRKGIVVGYHINKQGELTEFTRVDNPDGGAAHIAIHPNGRFLLTAQYGGGSTALFPLDENGELGEATVIEHEGGSKVVEKRQDSPHPHWCGFSPDGNYALVPDLGLDQIVIYKINHESNSIEYHGAAQSVPGGGPRHMRFSVDGKFIYLLNELSLSVTTFSWDAAAGTAKQLTTIAALTEEEKARESFNSAAEILVHPSGKFVYSSNRGHDSVSVFEANPETGELKRIQVQPIRGAFPRNINMTADGSWLFAAGADSNTISGHKIDADTGLLTYQRGMVVNVPAPICILFR